MSGAVLAHSHALGSHFSRLYEGLDDDDGYDDGDGDDCDDDDCDDCDDDDDALYDNGYYDDVNDGVDLLCH